MGGQNKNKQQNDLLAKIPPGAKKIQVRTADGKLRYKAQDDIAPDDEIQLNKNGIPIVMRGWPGRKNDVLEPVNDVVAEIIKQKTAIIEKDPIVSEIKRNPESPDVLHHIIVALGEETASIKFERQEAEREGKSTIGISTRRINSLRVMAETWLKRKEQLVTRGVDMSTPAFKVLFKFIMETFKEAMTAAGMRPEAIETVMSKLASQLDDDWEQEAKSRMKNIV